MRGAAVLSGSSARLVDADRRLELRVQPDGRTVSTAAPLEPGWRSLVVLTGEQTTVWLETTEHRALYDLVLERLASGIRVVLDRTRGRVVRDDEAAIEVLLDGAAAEASRSRAARRLGLAPDVRLRVVAMLPEAHSRRPELHGVRVMIERETDLGETRPAGRVGLGGLVQVPDAPRSWEEARTALRFTAAGTEADPGPTWNGPPPPPRGCSRPSTRSPRTAVCGRRPRTPTSTTRPCRLGCSSSRRCSAGRSPIPRDASGSSWRWPCAVFIATPDATSAGTAYRCRVGADATPCCSQRPHERDTGVASVRTLWVVGGQLGT